MKWGEKWNKNCAKKISKNPKRWQILIFGCVIFSRNTSTLNWLNLILCLFFSFFFFCNFFLPSGMGFSFPRSYLYSDIIFDFFANYFICSYWCSFCFYCRYVVSYLASHKLATFLDRDRLFAAKYHFNSFFFFCVEAKKYVSSLYAEKSVEKI